MARLGLAWLRPPDAAVGALGAPGHPAPRPSPWPCLSAWARVSLAMFHPHAAVGGFAERRRARRACRRCPPRGRGRVSYPHATPRHATGVIQVGPSVKGRIPVRVQAARRGRRHRCAWCKRSRESGHESWWRAARNLPRVTCNRAGRRRRASEIYSARAPLQNSDERNPTPASPRSERGHDATTRREGSPALAPRRWPWCTVTQWARGSCATDTDGQPRTMIRGSADQRWPPVCAADGGRKLCSGWAWPPPGRPPRELAG